MVAHPDYLYRRTSRGFLVREPQDADYNYGMDGPIVPSRLSRRDRWLARLIGVGLIAGFGYAAYLTAYLAWGF